MRLFLLGRFQLEADDGREISVPLKRARALLAYLALRQGGPRPRAESREAVLDLLWTDRFKTQAQGSLRQVLFQLGPDLVSAARTELRLGPGIAACDAWSLEAAARAAEADGLAAAGPIYAGPLLDGLVGLSAAFEQFLAIERAQYETLLERSQLRAAALFAEAGRIADAIAVLERLLRLLPSCHAAAERLMRLHAEAGEAQAARAVHDRFRDRLAREDGDAPGQAMTELMARLRVSSPVPRTPARTGERVQTQAAPGPEAGEALPVLAVLPFRDTSAGDGTSPRAAALSEEILLLLSRARWFRVLSRYATQAHLETASRHPTRFARKVGARYLVHGTLRDTGGGGTLNVELVDGLSGVIVWNERYGLGAEGRAEEINDTCLAIAAMVDPRMAQNEYRALLARPVLGETGSAAAYRHLIAGYHHYHGGARDEALAAFTRAVTADPGYAHAHAMLAIILYFGAHLARNAATDDAGWQHYLDKAETHARRALALDPLEAKAHLALAQPLIWRGRMAEGEASMEEAFRLNPSFAQASTQLSYLSMMRGEMREAREYLARAMRLRVGDHGLGYCLPARGLAAYHGNDHSEALEFSHWANRLQPMFWLGRQALAASLMASGQIERARHFVAGLRADYAGLSARDFARWVPYADPSTGDGVAASLERAGWR